MFWKVLRHVFVPSSGLDENNIEGHLLYPIVYRDNHIKASGHRSRDSKLRVNPPQTQSENNMTRSPRCIRSADTPPRTKALGEITCSDTLDISTQNRLGCLTLHHASRISSCRYPCIGLKLNSWRAAALHSLAPNHTCLEVSSDPEELD